eukprot:TRINITY_DN24292_c0_g1_i1.p1 TRINITY_DN24292_c0_g1~~TRINITY_DN24292_c0_g1_i1.p1  ORF type:complete len:242 (+),score=59.21 TRINITY_DN24292_c0_g1_i1:58-726(+)
MAVYEMYEQDYKDSVCHVEDCLSALEGGLLPLEASKMEADVKRTLESMRDSIKSMECEVGSDRGLKERMQGYKRQIASMTRKIGELEKERRAKLFDGKGEEGTEGMDDKERLIHTTDRTDAQTNKVTEAIQIAQMTEDVGNDILGNLHTQRVTIQRDLDMIEDTEHQVSTARALVRQLMSNITRNKMMVYLIIAVVSIMIIVIIWVNLSGDSPPPPPPPAPN